MSSLRFVAVADLDSLPPGRGRTVEIQGQKFSVWNVDGTFSALDDDCPHRGGPLGAGLLEDGKVYCPLHGWAFDARTGACLSNPSRPVRCHPTKVENGQIWIGLPSS